MSHIFSSNIGRPKLEISIEEIEYLRGMRFSWTKIAEVLGISRSTLYRKLEEEGLSSSLTYTDISDRNLDRVLLEIKSNHPNDGERLIIGHLAQRSITVPRSRIRAAIHRVDPVNTALRRSITVRRRKYHSAGPNAVWHLDGNHKLIRWRLVIHGGIDGFSRLIVFLHCSDNNRAETVLEVFNKAVDDHGLPTKVRTDLGGENTEVWRYVMEQHRDDSSVITGSSTHNERIERLWRDVYRCVGVLFADTFRMLEEEGKLDPLNETDIFCLHHVFKPRINFALNAFTESWNNHSLSTAASHTPNQLFLLGFLENNTTPQQPHPVNPFGATSPPPTSHVRVPRVNFQPCSALTSQISTINPLRESSDFGSDIYCEVIHLVGQHLQHGCDDCG